MNNWLKSLKDHKRFYTDPGDRYKIIYKPVVADDGTIDLVESEKTCLFDYIQSFKESCDINVLVKRFQMGDTAALMRGQTFFADITEMPKTFAEALQILTTGEDFFNKLPVEVKEKFGNNFNQFISAFGSDEFNDAVGIKRIEKVVEKPVKEGLESVGENNE